MAAAMDAQPAEVPAEPTAEVRRDALFEENAAWARGIALGVHRRLWAYSVDPADCIQNATVGLLEAIARFEPERGVPFRAYAAARVRGAVFNGLRTLVADSPPPAPQRLRDRVASLADAAGGEGDFDFFSELVGSLGVGFLLEDAWDLADRQDAFSYAERAQLQASLSDGMRRLPARHRDLLYQHYFLHRPFCRLAEEAGVTKGRISQLHHEALRRLRVLLGD